MSYITKEQLNLYLQKINGQPSGPGAGATGTTKSRSTLTGPRPPTFGAKASSRKIFQDGPPSAIIKSPRTPLTPVTPTSAQLEGAVKNLSLAAAPRAPSPILESMGEAHAPLSAGNEAVMESMGSEEYETPFPTGASSQCYGTYNGQGMMPGVANWPQAGYNTMPHHQQQQQHPTVGYGSQIMSPPSQFHTGYYDYHQQQHGTMSQEQYLMLQQQQAQQQEYLRQQHSAHAAAHGYHPTPNPAQSSGPGSTVIQQPQPSQTKSIMPRIVPIVDIPTYVTVVPPKTEIETLDDEKDDDWAPEPPPRDPPKKTDVRPLSRPHTPILSSFPHARPPTPKIVIPSSAPAVPDKTPSAKDEEEGDRIPLPPPREFRRKSVTPPTSATVASTATTRSSSNGIFSLGNSSSTTSVASSLPSSTTFSRPKGPSRSQGTPAPGTVRANSAKFNALAAAHGGSAGASAGVPNPKTVMPKVSSSVTIATDTTATATSNPWKSRKAVENLRRNSLSKGSGATALSSILPKARKSLDLPTDSARRNSTPLLPPVAYAEKALPPIRSTTPLSRPSTPRLPDPPAALDHEKYDADHDSKCILTEEDKEPTSISAIPAVQEKPESALNTIGANEKGYGSGPTSSAQTGFICSSCDEPISGMMITAMGKRWHSDHFVCSICDLNLEHVQFFQKDGLPYCHLDYHEKFSPRCGHCNSAIENECLTALGKSWHPGHFFCRECGDPFEEDGYMVHDDFPYCEKDYLRLFAPKCTGCQDPIQGDFINALKGKWHRDCFGCTVCHIGFDTTSYYVENGKPYCQAHYKTGEKDKSNE